MSHEPSAPQNFPSSVQVGPGPGGLEVVQVYGRSGSAEVFLHGAHVARWAPAGHSPVLWMSAHSDYLPGEPLRGGVPICFPWFGGHPTDPTAPAHGFARRADWTLAEAHDDGEDVVLTFVLADDEATRASAWPHPFSARYTVTVGATLTLALEITNTGADAVTFDEALHTYLSVHDIRSTAVTGLEGVPFLDRLAGPELQAGETGPIRFAAETDRIYPATEGGTTILDEGGDRSVRVDKRSSRTTVVWNPWVAKAASMPDFGDDEWTGMLCVETCNVGADAVHLEPGASHTMSTVLSMLV